MDSSFLISLEKGLVKGLNISILGERTFFILIIPSLDICYIRFRVVLHMSNYIILLYNCQYVRRRKSYFNKKFTFAPH